MNPETLLARELPGASPAMKRLRARLLRVAPTAVSVLLTGETGTGKTTVARLIHVHSQRNAGPLVKVNCAGIPDSLFESELFGHEKGAFTGALSRRIGLIPSAHGGSLFMDEIGDLSPAGQAKLLTVLDEGEVRPVGGTETLSVDVRLLSATCRDLDGRRGVNGNPGRVLREDLLHRVAVVRLHLPSLRDRREDLEPLVRNHLRVLARRHGTLVPALAPCAWRFLRDRPWPGNVRELVHLLEAALVLSSGADVLDRAAFMEALPEWVEGETPPMTAG